MKEAKDKNDDDFLLTFSDIIGVVKRNWRKMRNGAIIFACLGLLFGLTKPLQYQAEATFKEKGKTSSNLNNFMSTTMMMFSEKSHDSDAMTMMNSRKLIETLIENQGLQGNIVKSEYKFPLIPFETIKNNLILELALFKNSPFPALKDKDNDLRTTAVTYSKETPMSVRLRVKTATEYDVFDSKGRLLGSGTFGSPFSGEDFLFTIVKDTSQNIQGHDYFLNIQPLPKLATQMQNQFTIAPDKDDKSVISIAYNDSDRKQAANIVNALMKVYQEHIEKEHNLICTVQTEYLVQRQHQMGQELELMMHNYAKDLSSDMSATGFANSTKAMEFIAANQQVLKQKLFTISLEIQRLENAQQDASFDGELFSSTGNLDIFNKIAAEKRQLKQVYDSLNLAIRGVQDNSIEFHNTFAAQLADQEENKLLLTETSNMLAALDHNEMPRPHQKLLENPKFIVKEWYNRLSAARDHFDKNASNAVVFEEWQQCKEGFSCYLNHLNHFLKVNQRNVEERLANQQLPSNAEYLGINLNIAKDLYISYTKELCNLESITNERNFIIDQIDQPQFEISSLSTTLTDPVSTEMIKNASNITLTLRDHDNISTKGQERLLADLAIQKGFIKTHLQQSVELLKLRQELLRKKIREIQSVNFSLVQEELSILENQLKEYLAAALDNLSQEQALLTQNMAELRIEMSTFPQKWTAEQLIEHKMDINRTLVEEISKLVESKNVSNNMQKFQSAPLDLSVPPIHPKSPRLAMLTLAGAIAGAFLSFIWILGWSVFNGVKAIPETLRAASLHVSGSISRQYRNGLDKEPVLDSDLDTLRRLMAYILPKPSEEGISSPGHTLLLLEGKGPDYSKPLAELMSKKGLKVLIVDLRFGGECDSKAQGMLQFLEGKGEHPAIHHENTVDTIPSGGICRYANELIGSQKFRELIASLQMRYDWVIITSNALPASAEMESLLELFPTAAISVQDETIDHLRGAIFHARKPASTISFVFV